MHIYKYIYINICACFMEIISLSRFERYEISSLKVIEPWSKSMEQAIR
jgi:hypothetical protein